MIAWYLVFTVFYNEVLYHVSTSPMTKTQCEQMHEGAILAWTEEGADKRFMWGGCFRTLEATHEDNTGPEFLN